MLTIPRMSRAPSRYFVLAPRVPGARDHALGRDVHRDGDRVVHARGVAAFPTLADAVDLVFGPPAHPFEVLAVDRPAGQVRHVPGNSGAVTAVSWRVIEVVPQSRVFGVNGEHVVALLDRLVEPQRFNLPAARRLAAELMITLSDHSSTVNPAEAVWAWRAELDLQARRANLAEEGERACAAVRSTCWDRVLANVPRAGWATTDWDVVSGLLSCAAVWPAVHAAAANPFAPAVELARMNAFPAAEDNVLCCWRRGTPVICLEGQPPASDAAEVQPVGTPRSQAVVAAC